MRETVSVIKDFKSEKLQPGEMYNYRDLTQLVSEMEEEVRDLVDKVRASRGCPAGSGAACLDGQLHSISWQLCSRPAAIFVVWLELA